jgi:hypothetical protein
VCTTATRQAIAAWLLRGPRGDNPDVPERSVDEAHDLFCVAVGFEVVFCFLVPFFFLVVGAVYLPILVVGAVMRPQDTWAWKAVAQILLGSAGVAGVSRTVYLIWTKARNDQLRWVTLLGLVCGAAVSIDHWFTVSHGRAPGGTGVLTVIVYVPLACTLHLLYLARRPLFSIGRGEP